ncbi:F-box/FBD/LRR-repeat protein At1g13570-like [Rhododendron vialii]|uniref:F-box/FBD/LRR-repeat protein At1g13570-like n=1 Tax=Rhododendron vialii TaxID=182163 RepID=UPI00265FC968|nr:F-box/FBD/LRR-repeat protein At1g13570-like [Rhododendron vialii]
MEITRKRRNLNANGDLDLISNLPRHIIDCVLNRLPFQDAVRTSILSPKWRGYWATLQHLDLGYEFYLFVKDAVENKLYSYDRYKQYDKYIPYEYERIISRIFFFQLGPLVKVTLYIPKFVADDYPVYPVPDTEKWILHLSKKNIKELTITYKNRKRHLLPSCFFLCLNLTHLELSYIFLVPPPDFKGFRNLIAIQCTGVKFKANMFESLMHGSPLLQKLVFVDCSGMDHFKVSAPNLEILRFEDYRKFETIGFENVPKLADVTISTLYTEVDHFAKSSHLLEFLTSLPKVTRLSLNGDFLRFLAGDTLPQQLPTTVVEGLKYLKLNSLDFANFHEVSCALCLIRSTPNLKQLEIQASTTREDILAPKWGYMEAKGPFGCTLDGLRVVKMKLIRGFKPELELVQFLLANSPFLEKMSIDWSPYTGHSQTQQKLILDMATELIRCYRAISPTLDISLG